MGKTVRAWASITLLSVAAATPAFADANAVARAVSERFARACAAGDIQAVVAMYEDDAIAVWPGEGAEGAGKPAIEKLATGLCTGKASARLSSSVAPTVWRSVASSSSTANRASASRSKRRRRNSRSFTAEKAAAA